MIAYSILKCKKDKPLLVHERTVRPEGVEEEGRLEIDLVRLKMIISIIPLIMIMMKIITLMVIMVITLPKAQLTRVRVCLPQIPPTFFLQMGE